MAAQPPTDDSPLTRLLNLARNGDGVAAAEVAERVRRQLDLMARQLIGSRSGLTIEAGDLVNEAWIKLSRLGDSPWDNSGHFFKVAAASMRSVLVDRARRRGAQKRGGANGKINVDDVDPVLLAYESRAFDLVALDELLEQLQAVDGESARVVELRFFAGLTVKEVADVLGLPVGAVERLWRQARAWLLSRLDPDAPGTSHGPAD